jgi:Family of unknown function (DUF6510)
MSAMHTMHDNELRLDGNAVAGVLSGLFAKEPTMVELVCASCGAGGTVGAVHVYAQGPGAVLRCPACSAMLMRVAEIRGKLVADLRGISRLEL